VRQHATTEMQVTAAQMQKQYEEIRRELDVLNKQRGDDQRRIEKLGQDNAALAEQVKALGANPVTATGEPVPQMPASPPGPEGEPQPGNTPVSFPPQGSVAVPPPTAFYPGNGVTPPPQVTYQSVPVPNRIPEHSVTEFSHSQEAKLAEAQQKAMLKGEAFPDIPMTLYEAIVRDYTGRTPEAREQTLIVTHLNEDRRVLNSMIHDAREKAGELGKEQVMVPVLNTANIRDGELRRLSTWETHRDALALVDNVYHRIAGISKDDGLITLQDAEGNTRLISPREAVAEGVTLYTPDTIRVGTGDRMRFTKSDRERGYVANSVWTVTAVSGDSVTLSDGQQTRVIRPGQERAEQHIDLAYAITAHGAQGASETFAIALEGTEGNRKQMAGFESAYVALSRMKQHVQVYTDNRQGWTDAINNAVQKGTAHDVLEPKSDREVMNAERLFSTARELRDVVAGRAVLRQAGLAGGDSPARFIAPGRKYPQPYVALPAFDRNGKSAGIWLNPLTTDDGNGLRGFSGEGRVKGSGDAQFVALQGSRNGESLLADN
ncbi:conjugative transfer relaxase/helicase TraI domain-containing protein, partial [Escherichia coli]|uniref:conjugative transfer relaxase/helicase TraI domain-containing protein n=1 Tax=Escherichia coli TaxID=562 RepID=UPI0025A07524